MSFNFVHQEAFVPFSTVAWLDVTYRFQLGLRYFSSACTLSVAMRLGPLHYENEDHSKAANLHGLHDIVTVRVLEVSTYLVVFSGSDIFHTRRYLANHKILTKLSLICSCLYVTVQYRSSRQRSPPVREVNLPS